MKCEDCKNKIEESKPKFIKSFLGYPLLMVILSILAVILFITVEGTEILSLGERLILLIFCVFIGLSLIFLPIGAEDLKKNYELSYMKKYSVIKHFGKIVFLPYLLLYLYFGIVIFSFRDLIFGWLQQTATILFCILWWIPFIIYIADKKLNLKLFKGR